MGLDGRAGRSGHWVVLVPFAPEHHGFVYELAVADPSSFHGLFPFGIPDRDGFAERLGKGVSNCFVVVGRKSGRPLGLAFIYRWSRQHEVAYFQLTLIPSARGSGIGVEAAYLFVAYTFSSFNIRKLYVEAGAWQLAAVRRAIGTLLQEEGCLRDHRSFGGRWHDQVFLSIDRARYRGDERGLRGILAQCRRSAPSGSVATESRAPAETSPPAGSSSRWKALGNELRSLESGRVRLVPAQPSHLKYLFGLATAEDVGHNWRFGGAIPTIQEFQQGFHQGVFAQFVAVLRRNGHPFGHLVAYQADPLNGHVYIGGVTEARLHRTGFPIDAFVILMRYLFGNWNFRKIYMDLPEFNRSQILAGGIIEGLTEEARLRDVIYHDGSWWDRSILAINQTFFMTSLGLGA